MTELPPEVWHHIASFMGPRELVRLASLSRVFFELAMDRQWRSIKFSTAVISNDTLKRFLDPCVGKRVHDMTLILYNERRQRGARTPQKLIDLFISSFGLFRGENGRKRGLDLQPQYYGDFGEVIRGVIRFAPKLDNVRKLAIRCTWSLIPKLSHNAMRPPLASFSSVVGVNLHCLSLDGSLDELGVMLENRPTFNSLKELHIAFKENSHESEDIYTCRSALVDIIAPFIHGLGTHLKDLSITSYCEIEAQELEDFFLAISPLHSLARLDIHAAFIKPSQYPRSLMTLFTENLHHLSLPLIPFKLHLEPAIQEPLRYWLLACISNENLFTELRSLDIYPTKTSEGLRIALAYIRRSAKHLSQLTIRSRSMQPEEVPTLVHALAQCHCLTDLSFNIHRLDIAAFDQLSRELPHLHRLCISVKERLVLRDINEADSLLFEDLKTRQYADWNLRDIWLKNVDENVHRDVMLVIARSLPSVRYIFGVPVLA